MILYILLLNLVCFGKSHSDTDTTITENKDGSTTITYKYLINQPGESRRRLNHYWEDYHWKNTEPHLYITVGDCHTPSSTGKDWSSLLETVIYNWNNVPENQDGSGEIYIPTNSSLIKGTCRNSMINSFNGNYGDTDWLGIAYLSANIDGTITRVETHINEYHYNSYSSTGWQHVLCHEIGHGIPLNHQSESGADKDTCMDYSIGNKYPNYHDVEIINSIYGEYNYTTTKSADDEWYYELEDYWEYVVMFFIFIILITICICIYCVNQHIQPPSQPYEDEGFQPGMV